MDTHTEPAELAPAMTAQPEPEIAGLRPVDLRTESPSGTGPSVSKIRFVGVGAAGQPQPVTLADLLDVEPDAGQCLAVYELKGV